MPSQRVRLHRALIWALCLALFGSVILPTSVPTDSSRYSAWDKVRSWFIGEALADDKGVPKQQSGDVGDPEGLVPSGKTRAKASRGRAPGRGRGDAVVGVGRLRCHHEHSARRRVD